MGARQHTPAVCDTQVWRAFMEQFGSLRRGDGSIDLPPEALTQARSRMMWHPLGAFPVRLSSRIPML